MAFTDNCDLFAAVHEEGVNRVINHIRRQRPSWFNYASADIAGNRELWCEQVEVTKDVEKYFNPIFSVQPAIPVLGSETPPVEVGFCAQLTKALIDFHPGNVVELPEELAPLPEQRFSLALRACAGLVCASDRDIDQLPVGTPGPADPAGAGHPKEYPPVVVRGKPACFCLDIYVVGHFERTAAGFIIGKVDGIEIVDIEPRELEDSIECYVRTVINVTLRQKLALSLETLTLNFPLFDIATITLSPTANPPVSNNPAVEEDQLKVFVTMTV